MVRDVNPKRARSRCRRGRGVRPVPVQMQQGADAAGGCAQSRCRCGRSEPSPGADVEGVSPVPVQIWAGEPCPGADVAGLGPVPEKPRLACYRLLRTCFALGRRRSAEAAQRAVGLKDPVPVQMWAGVGPVLVQTHGAGALRRSRAAREALANCNISYHVATGCSRLVARRCRSSTSGIC